MGGQFLYWETIALSHAENKSKIEGGFQTVVVYAFNNTKHCFSSKLIPAYLKIQ